VTEAALRAALLADAHLEAAVERLSETVSAVFARGRIRTRAKPDGSEQKVADGGGSNMSVAYYVTRRDHRQRDVDADRSDQVRGLSAS
jgi:hypothetical protein